MTLPLKFALQLSHSITIAFVDIFNTFNMNSSPGSFLFFFVFFSLLLLNFVVHFASVTFCLVLKGVDASSAPSMNPSTSSKAGF